MALDPSLPLQVRGPQPMLGPMDLRQKQLGLMSGLMQIKTQEAQIAQAQRQMEEEQALRDAVAQSGGDWQAVSKALLGRGMVKPALEIEGMLAKRQTEVLAAEKAQREMSRLRVQDGVRLLVGVNDPQSYQQAREIALRRGHAKPEDWPEQYDPGAVQTLINEGRTLEDLLKQDMPLTEIAKIIKDRDAGRIPSGLANAALTKQTTFAPPQTIISMGAPQMMTDASGTPVAVQFPNRPGEQPQITALPGLKPQAPAGQQHLTEGEGKGTLFYSQMNTAEKEIKNIVGSGFNPDSMSNQLSTRLAGSDWTNWLAPKNAQRYAQATEQWAEAFLRLKTGAATTRDEIRRNARAYFPQPGDGPDVVRQKNEMRAAAIDDVGIVAGRGLEKLKARDAGAAPRSAGYSGAFVGDLNAAEAEIKRSSMPDFEKAKALDALRQQRQGNQSAAPQEGQKAKSKSGKPITYRNGQWEYD